MMKNKKPGKVVKSGGNKSSPSGPSGPLKHRDLRERIIARDNWNFFVSDEEYRTDFFMRFKTPFIQQQYEKSLIYSSVYSLRILLVAITALSYYV